jgi:hypothetical protein
VCSNFPAIRCRITSSGSWDITSRELGRVFEFPATARRTLYVLVVGQHLKDFGWCVRISSDRAREPLHLDRVITTSAASQWCLDWATTPESHLQFCITGKNIECFARNCPAPCNQPAQVHITVLCQRSQANGRRCRIYCNGSSHGHFRTAGEGLPEFVRGLESPQR